MALATTEVEQVLDKALEFLGQRIGIEAAYLFGSYVAGTPHEYSDIDLAVFSPDLEGMSLRERFRLCAEAQLHSDDRLELHIYPASALKKARPTNFYGYILEHGRKVR